MAAAGGPCRSMLLRLLVLGLCAITWSSAQSVPPTTPPRGWNSYDSFSWIVSEDEFLQNAAILSSFPKQLGYEYVVVDFLWFRKNQNGVSVNTPGFDLIDQWGRPVPDPDRWPSTANGRGFAPIAAKVHAMGLKFGIHVMRGISTAAVQQNTPVLGAKGWNAKDIALTTRPCSWMNNCFVSVNTSSHGGKAFINSLYKQYASWGVDFIKHDCVFGEDDLSLDEIQAVSQSIVSTGRPMVYSLSPGVRATTSMGQSVANYVNMYRITSDDWDTWADLQLHFDVARHFAAANLIGAPGLAGGLSWPDLDMLPLGWITDPGVRMGPHRFSSLTPDEQKLQMTLWALAKSPLIYGGDLRKIDNFTYSLITNPALLDINSHSVGNAEIIASADSKNQASPVLRLVSCDKTAGTRWTVKTGNKLCFSAPKYNNGSSDSVSGCMDWNASPSNLRCSLKCWLKFLKASVVSRAGTALFPRKLGTTADTCLDSHGRQPIDSGDFISNKVGPCGNRHSQKWRVERDGSLVNRKTGQCAAIFAQAYVSRVWSARGSDGEYHVGLFNIGSQPSQVAVPVATVLGDKSSKKASWQCTAVDVWNNQKVGAVTDMLQASVPAHGCALFTMTCSL